MIRSIARRLSTFYFLFFASLGAFVPYRGRYFDAQGFDSFTIGAAMAMTSLVTIAAPFAWALIADRWQKHRQVLLVGCVGSVVFTASAFFQQQALLMIASIALYSICWNAIGPQTENLTLTFAAKHGGDYSRIRLWGSVGYIITVLAVGYGVQWAGVITVVPFTLGFMGLLSLLCLGLPKPEPHARDQRSPPPMRQNVLRPPVLAILGACLLVTMSHAPFYTFFDLYLRHHHYQAPSSGWLITLGVIAEIVLFLFAKRIIAAFDFSRLLLCALLLAALRWSLLAAFVDVLFIVIVVQLLHAISFALMHSAAMHFLHRVFPPLQRPRAQALYGAIAYGLGGTLGNLLSGIFWQEGQGGAKTFYMAGFYCLIAAALMFWQRHAISGLMHDDASL